MWMAQDEMRLEIDVVVFSKLRCTFFNHLRSYGRPVFKVALILDPVRMRATYSILLRRKSSAH
jgi:hypothetical protein